MSKITNILIGGVGGQGILLASEILSDVALEAGLDVKKSEVHGMAQRGGSVVCNVRFGEKVYSPLIKKGEADVILSFEPIESIRWTEYASKDCSVYSNTQQIYPMSVTFGDSLTISAHFVTFRTFSTRPVNVSIFVPKAMPPSFTCCGKVSPVIKLMSNSDVP